MIWHGRVQVWVLGGPHHLPLLLLLHHPQPHPWRHLYCCMVQQGILSFIQILRPAFGLFEGVGFSLHPISTLLHIDPAAHQDHCETVMQQRR